MQPKLYLHSSFFLLFLLFAANVPAQPGGSKVFFPEGNNTKIYSLFKNNNGCLLAGCSNGLYNFNGTHFTKIETNKPAITDTVTAIFQDNKNELWAGFKSGRIAATINGKLTYLDPEEGTPKKRITAFIQDRLNNIWFSTRGEGIYYFSNKKLYLINEENGLADLNVHALATTFNGDVLAATDQGLSICQTNNTKKTVATIGPSQGLPDYIVTAIEPAGNNLFWVGMQEKGICLYNHQSKTIAPLPAFASWANGQVNSLKYSHGKLWIATQDSGLFCYNNSNNTLLWVNAIAGQQTPINCIEEDNHGNLWLAAGNTSLIRSAYPVLQLHPAYPETFFETTHALCVSADGSFWAGTDMAVMKYWLKGKSYFSKKYPIAGLGIKTDITSLYEDNHHNIWVGTMGNGIHVLDAATGHTRQLTEALPSGSILSITGNGNTVCAAGLEGAIVFELSEANQNISNTYSFTVYNNIQTIGSNYVYNVYKDSRKRLWFATDGKGLTMLHNGQYTHYNETSGLQDNHIYSITEDAKGNIWFSTSNAGVYCFDGSAFINFGVKEGMSTLAISTVKTDKQGNIVVAHKNGFDIINTANGNISYINETMGLSNVNEALGGVCKGADGNIYATTLKGIASYSAPENASHSPKTMIENVQLFLNSIDTATFHYFRYDENNIQFNFTGLYYTDPEHVFFEYKLDGLYNRWQFTADNSRAFPKLPPGKYVFRVRSSLNKNFANASEAAFAFEIAKPFWKTWWFITGSLLAIVALLYWLIKARERRFTHVQQLQNEKVKFEFEVLRNQVNPHFLFNSFNTLISTIEDNPKAGVEYVEQLSDFFRNIVNYRDKNTISLKEEVALLQNYLYLQQKRYGSSLQLSIDVDEQAQQNIFLPPLTLQLLMENAIKHNVVSKETVLKIEMRIEGAYLIVQNNINKKITKEKGTGMGLENIKNRYALLHKNPVQVSDNGKDFIVRLPILKN